MDIRNAQERMASFFQERGWYYSVNDTLLHLKEEVGELTWLARRPEQSTDPANTLQNVLTIRSGTANDESTRYGDYFGAATDPTGTSTFWVTGEYRVDEIFQNWSTAIAQVQIA